MSELIDDFNEYTNGFTKLPIDYKQKEIIYELKLMISFLNKLNIDIDNDKKIMINKALLHDTNKQIDESIYLDTIFNLVQSMKNELGKYVDGMYKKY